MNFNIAERRAQESVELALKGALKILGVEYPKVHEVVKYIVKSPKGNYGERSYGKEEAEEAYQSALFVFKTVKKMLNI